MDYVLAKFSKKDIIYIKGFGMEDDSSEANWGWGCRDEYNIQYVTEGEGYFNNTRIGKGEGIFILPNQLHEYHSSTDKPWRYRWVSLSGSMAGEIIKKYITPNEKGIFTFDFANELDAFFTDVISSDTILDSAEALSHFFRLLSFHEKKTGQNSNKYVMMAKNHIKLNYHRNISVSEVAALMGINDRYLYNLFIRHEGISPKQYINKVRLKRACDLLKTTGNSVSEIGVSVGFTDVLTFSRFFSKNMGMSPTQYRTQNV